jgi:putative flippase GtrA
MRLKSFIANHAATINQFLKFGIVGFLGFGIDSGFLYLGIHALGLSHVAAGLFSFPFAVLFTWVGNRVFTFRDAASMPAAKQLVKFIVVCVIGLVFNRGTYSLLVTYVPFVHTNWVLGVVAGTGVGMFFNFFAARKHVFGL